MKIRLKTGEIFYTDDRFIDLTQKLVMFYIYERTGGKVYKRKIFVNPEIIELIEFENLEEAENIEE
jgi:hypothetical protein